MSELDEIEASSSYQRRGVAYQVLTASYVPQMIAQGLSYLVNQ